MIAQRTSSKRAKIYMITALMFLGACAQIPAESARALTPESVLAQFTQTEDYKYGKDRAKARAINYLPNGCKNVRFLDEPPVVVVQEKPIQNPNFPEMLSGKWRESYRTDSCGKIILQNLNYVVSATKNFEVSVSAPGNSRTTLPQQARIIAPAARAALSKLGSASAQCPPRLWNTEARGGKGAANWTEIWYFDVCDQSVTVELNFKRNREGKAVVSFGS